MKTFLDSSAFEKRYIEESGSNIVEELCSNATELGLSIICVPEIMSALTCRIRDTSLTQKQYNQAKNLLAKEVADATIIQVSPEIINKAMYALETNIVRTLDALHLASAMHWKADLFVSSDKRQLEAAKNLDLMTRQV